MVCTACVHVSVGILKANASSNIVTRNMNSISMAPNISNLSFMTEKCYRYRYEVMIVDTRTVRRERSIASAIWSMPVFVPDAYVQ